MCFPRDYVIEILEPIFFTLFMCSVYLYAIARVCYLNILTMRQRQRQRETERERSMYLLFSIYMYLLFSTEERLNRVAGFSHQALPKRLNFTKQGII